jgi:pyrroline-5-carboxylate reductase
MVVAKKLGFIGAGNLAAAIIGGAVKAGEVNPADVIVSDASGEQLSKMAASHRVEVTTENAKVAAQADILFLSIKPNVYETVIAEIKNSLKQNALVVILAAGLSIAAVQKMFGGATVKLIKAMPNTPAMVNCGMTAICTAENMPSKFDDLVESGIKIFESIGKVEILPERLFDAFTAIAGSSPAYVYTFIEAMADAGVKNGLSREQALCISTQAVFGSAAMVQQTGEHPAVLRDAVCSPSGTTIEAVCELERQGFRNAVISGVNAVATKYNEMR